MKDRSAAKVSRFDHVDLLFPGKYLKSADLQGRDVVVIIEEIDPRHELKSQQGTEYKPVVALKGKEKLWVLNKTNAKTIGEIHGSAPSEWPGKSVTIFPTTVSAGGKVHECIRVRTERPTTGSAPNPAADIAAAEKAITDKALKPEGHIIDDGASKKIIDDANEPVVNPRPAPIRRAALKKSANALEKADKERFRNAMELEFGKDFAIDGFTAAQVKKANEILLKVTD